MMHPALPPPQAHCDTSIIYVHSGTEATAIQIPARSQAEWPDPPYIVIIYGEAPLRRKPTTPAELMRQAIEEAAAAEWDIETDWAEIAHRRRQNVMGRPVRARSVPVARRFHARMRGGARR